MEIATRIRKPRLALVVFLLILAAWLGKSGQWKNVTSLPSTLQGQIYKADYDANARAKGTTTEKIAEEFYQRQVAANNRARAEGKVECEFWSSGKDCFHRPLQGVPAIVSEIGLDDIIEGTRRTAIKSIPLLTPLFGSLLADLFLVFALPLLARGFWRWLRQH